MWADIQVETMKNIMTFAFPDTNKKKCYTLNGEQCTMQDIPDLVSLLCHTLPSIRIGITHQSGFYLSKKKANFKQEINLEFNSCVLLKLEDTDQQSYLIFIQKVILALDHAFTNSSHLKLYQNKLDNLLFNMFYDYYTMIYEAQKGGLPEIHFMASFQASCTSLRFLMLHKDLSHERKALLKNLGTISVVDWFGRILEEPMDIIRQFQQNIDKIYFDLVIHRKALTKAPVISGAIYVFLDHMRRISARYVCELGSFEAFEAHKVSATPRFVHRS